MTVGTEEVVQESGKKSGSFSDRPVLRSGSVVGCKPPLSASHQRGPSSLRSRSNGVLPRLPKPARLCLRSLASAWHPRRDFPKPPGFQDGPPETQSWPGRLGGGGPEKAVLPWQVHPQRRHRHLGKKRSPRTLGERPAWEAEADIEDQDRILSNSTTSLRS